MSTKVYGHSDDLVEIEGDVRGEIGCFGTDDRDNGVLLACSDGTHLEVKYGKGGLAVWRVTLLRKGDLFDRIDECHDEDAKPYSDVAHFKDGLTYVIGAKEWERTQ